MKIDYTIVNIINKQIESYGNRISRVQVDKSKYDKRSVKIIDDVLYVKALESEYEIARIAAAQINRKIKEDILEPIDEIYRSAAIENFKVDPEQEKRRKNKEIERNIQRRYRSKKLNKKRIKREKRRRNVKKFLSLFQKSSSKNKTNKKKVNIKGFAGLAVLIPGMIVGTMAASKSIKASEINNQDDRNIIVEYGNENFESDEQIRESINDMLKSEISKATGENDDISFESAWIDSKTKKTVLNVGDAQYKYIKELEGRSSGNLSGEVANLIDAARTADDTEELMSTWIRVKKFSKNKDLKIEGNKLVEIDSKEEDIER